MRKILVVDDTPYNLKLVADLLSATGYEVCTATSGAEALERVETEQPELVVLDVLLPGLSGYEVCRAIRQDPTMRLLPVVMVTALDPREERVRGIEAGADDFLSKPINTEELLARVRSLLSIKDLQDTVRTQAAKLAELNASLAQRVQEQVAELERMGQLKRFLAPQLAELIAAEGVDALKPCRKRVSVVFVDLRDFTLFAESAEPEEVMEVLAEYHRELGRLVMEHEGTLERFTGDGMMIVFNAPIEVPNPEERAVRMAVAMRDAAVGLREHWRRLGHQIDVGIGIGTGFATTGIIGFEGRQDYSAIGSVTNQSARLCAAAAGGQILVSDRFLSTVEHLVESSPIGELNLKGFRQPVMTHDVVGLSG